MLWRLVCRWLQWSPDWGVDHLASPSTDAWSRLTPPVGHNAIVDIHFPDQLH